MIVTKTKIETYILIVTIIGIETEQRIVTKKEIETTALIVT